MSSAAQPRPLPALRQVFHGEALAWLAANEALEGCCVITSLPDISETSGLDFAAWRAWFITAARRIVRWLPTGGTAIFFQSDIRYGGTWVDKGYLIMRAVEEESASLVWHKIVCRKPPGTISQGRSTYAHMICVSKQPRPAPIRPGPDVLADAGFMPWSRAMGEEACRLACKFLYQETTATVIVDPFCGQGSVLAVANSFGFAAVGIDLNKKRCGLAQQLTITKTL